jgi:isopenicillin-N N-acyltransferase-like protein
LTHIDRVPELLVSGSPRDRGLTHGRALSAQIRRTLDYYFALFGLKESSLRDIAQGYGERIGLFSRELAMEMLGIAEGADLEPWTIYALNSRSEIINNCTVSECTSVVDTRHALLGQNWDWSEPLEELVVLLRVEREDGHRIATLTEPGMLAKVGMNSAGLGVCLNILKTERPLSGLPVHVLLRAILECTDLDQVRALISEYGTGKASHVLAADAAGGMLSAEFAGETWHLLQAQDGLLLHTNHYLADESLNCAEAFPSTRERLSRGLALLRTDNSREGLWGLLQDDSNDTLAICRPYSPSGTDGFGDVGTVFSLLMDLDGGEMTLRKGCWPGNRQYTVRL